ncbi:MAG: polyprenyl synthetase family protein, partial [Armatimonadetes bacterium]|nr:polyprenyl synthetase family protein [Armatimonadota bacterium]
MSISYPSAKSEWTPLRLIESELKLVEETLYATLASPVGTIDAVTRHLVGAGGKRLRPSLVILSAYASDKPVDIDTMIKLAAGVELIHMAT